MLLINSQISVYGGSNSKTPIGLSGEIISQSQIEKEFLWPDSDPRSKWQPIRNLSADDETRTKLLGVSPHFNLQKFLERTKTFDQVSRIIELLNHRAFQFNSHKDFRECSEWRNRITMACAENKPIDILILAFCVISNPTNQVQLTEVTLAEDVSLLHMNQIAKHLACIYSPGAIFQVISDSTFYALPFGVTSVESQNYINKLRRRTIELEISETVKILDITDYLSNHNQHFQTQFEFWRNMFLSTPLSNNLSQDEYKRWHRSMLCSLNSRRMGFDYHQLASIFRTDSYISNNSLDDCATVALAEYRALKAAAADTQWEDKYFPYAVRATIHTKKIPVLGLRLYPKYKLSSRLLPYHGIAVISFNDKDKGERMEIKHEISVIGNPSYTRVINSDGITMFYERNNS